MVRGWSAEEIEGKSFQDSVFNQLSSTHPVCGYQKGTPLAIGTPHLAVLRYIVRTARSYLLKNQ
jgi:hypothetical protein